MAAHGIRPRWGQPLTGIISSVVFTLIALVLWWIFADPRGPIAKYEQPFLAFLAWMILVGVWQHILFGDWPFQKLPPLQRLIVETAVNIFMTWFIIYVILDKFLGKVMMPIWSVTQMEHITHEHAHILWESPVGAAITLIVLIGFFTFPFWTILFKKWPWGGQLSQPALGMAEWGWTAIITALAYGLLIFPFFALALKQTMLTGSIWWEGIAGTKSVNFIIGWYEWMIVYLFMTANVWAGKPWDLVKKQPWSGFFGLFSIIILAFITVKVLMAAMAAIYGPADPTLKDGIMSLDYRYYHCATIAGFTLFPFLAWNHWFDNWPQHMGVATGWIIRTIGVFVCAAIIGKLYYLLCEPVLGLPSQFVNNPVEFNGHHLNNKPLVWLFWWIIPMLFFDWFAHKWPFYVEDKADHSAGHGTGVKA